MAFFASRPDDSPSVIADNKIRAYAQEQGGATLEFWRLALCRIWGDPIMMTTDQAAARLGWPIDEAEEIDTRTMRTCGFDRPRACTPPPPD